MSGGFVQQDVQIAEADGTVVVVSVSAQPKKGNAIEDLKKAAWYIQREIQRRTGASE